jgi:hypothetical protein
LAPEFRVIAYNLIGFDKTWLDHDQALLAAIVND